MKGMMVMVGMMGIMGLLGIVEIIGMMDMLGNDGDGGCSRLCIMDDSCGFLMLYSYSVRLANEKFTETVSKVNMNAW